MAGDEVRSVEVCDILKTNQIIGLKILKILFWKRLRYTQMDSQKCKPYSSFRINLLIFLIVVAMGSTIANMMSL